MLASHLREESRLQGAHVLDLCTGSGVLAVTAGLAGAARVDAVDVSRRAVLCTRLNARLNGVGVRARRGNLFAPVAGRRFDLIVSNPPYLPGPEEGLPRYGASRAWEAGPRGRLIIDQICDGATAHLSPNGALLLLHSSVCGVPETLGRLSRHGLDAAVVFSQRGPLGPILRARAGWLREQGLGDGEQEDVVIIRAQRPPAARAPASRSIETDSGALDRLAAERSQ
jgi:release factor glutamine methyltransferase